MPNTAEILVDTLIEWKVDVVFGLPGDGINGIMEALRTRRDRITFIQARHEESAAFMATAYAKWTGRLGVCLATSGPGGTHLLTGLYDAKLDRAPVLAITGMQFHDLIETFTQQDVDLVRVFSDVAVFNAQVSDAAHMESVAGLACRSALARHGVAHLSVASDVQEQSLAESMRSRRNRPRHTPERWFEGRPRCDPAQLEKAAAILNGASKVAILAGRGALGAAAEVEEIADMLAAPVAKALLGKAVLPDGHPHSTGGIGMLGTLPSQEIMEQCEALLIVGSSFPYIEYYPDPEKCRSVQIDHDAQRIGLRQRVDAGLVGDAAETMRLLAGKLVRKTDRGFLRQAQKRMSDWRAMMRISETGADMPLKPQRVVRAFGENLPDNAVIAADSGQNTELAARHIDIKAGQAFFGIGIARLHGLRPALCHCRRHRLSRASRLRGGRRWRPRHAARRVLDCGPLQDPAQAPRHPQQHAEPDRLGADDVPREPQFACELQPIDFALAARAMGGIGYSVARPEQVDSIIAAAFAAEGPVIIEAVVDAYEPMMPPRMPDEYRRNLRKALPETPGREKIEANLRREPLKSMMG